MLPFIAALLCIANLVGAQTCPGELQLYELDQSTAADYDIDVYNSFYQTIPAMDLIKNGDENNPNPTLVPWFLLNYLKPSSNLIDYKWLRVCVKVQCENGCSVIFRSNPIMHPATGLNMQALNWNILRQRLTDGEYTSQSARFQNICCSRADGCMSNRAEDEEILIMVYNNGGGRMFVTDLHAKGCAV